MEHVFVADVMTKLVVRFYPTDTVEQATRRLAQNDITGGPVVEGGRVVGVISGVDLVKSEVWAHVSRVMSSHVISISPAAPVVEAAELMERHVVKRLPVLDEAGFLIGIVSRSDVIRAIASTTREAAGVSGPRT